METFFGALVQSLLIAGGFLVAVMIIVFALQRILVICPPNRVLVISGRRRTTEGGGKAGYRTVFGGRAFRIPLLEKVDEMDLTTMPIEISVRNAYSRGGIALNLHAIANVKVSSDKKIVMNAVERFLQRDRSDVERVVRETLEGNLREVLATLTPEEVNEDRLKFAQKLSEAAEEDLMKLGLHQDTLKIQHVSDDSNYLESIGRERIARIVRDAEIAESNARRESESAEASAKARANVGRQRAEADVARARNEFRQVRAELELKAKGEEERTEAAAQEARARAEQELQTVRLQLEKIRLQADQVLPAEAQREALELQAKAQAATITENGRATAEGLKLMADAWKAAGNHAQEIFIIQHIERLLSTVVNSVSGLEVDEVNLLDTGDGTALASYASSFPNMVSSVLTSLKDSTGIDIPGVLAGEHQPEED